MDCCPICGREAVDGVLDCSHSLEEWAQQPLTVMVEGTPLDEIGLGGAIIVDKATGEDIEPLQGFIGIPGKSVKESLEEFLGPYRTIRLPRRAKPN
jgi:hypothetical protein